MKTKTEFMAKPKIAKLTAAQREVAWQQHQTAKEAPGLNTQRQVAADAKARGVSSGLATEYVKTLTNPIPFGYAETHGVPALDGIPTKKFQSFQEFTYTASGSGAIVCTVAPEMNAMYSDPAIEEVVASSSLGVYRIPTSTGYANLPDVPNYSNWTSDIECDRVIYPEEISRSSAGDIGPFSFLHPVHLNGATASNIPVALASHVYVHEQKQYLIGIISGASSTAKVWMQARVMETASDDFLALKVTAYDADLAALGTVTGTAVVLTNGSCSTYVTVQAIYTAYPSVRYVGLPTVVVSDAANGDSKKPGPKAVGTNTLTQLALSLMLDGVGGNGAPQFTTVLKSRFQEEFGTDFKQIRPVSAMFWLTNITPELKAGGSVAAMLVTSGEDPFNMGEDFQYTVQSKIVGQRGSYSGKLVDGVVALWRPRNAIEASRFQDARYMDAFKDAPYITMAYTCPADSQTLKMSMWVNYEAITTNPLYTATLNPGVIGEIERTLFQLNDLPAVMENPLHWAAIGDFLKNFAKNAYNNRGAVLKAAAPLAALHPGAAAALPMLQAVSNMLPAKI